MFDSAKSMVRTTKEALKFLASIPDIHMGGCLLSAFVFYLNEERAGRGKNFQIVSLSREADSYYTNNKLFLEGISDYADASYHYGWTFDGGRTVYDCLGKIKDEYKYVLLVPQHRTKEFCLSALNYGDWFWVFQRGTYLPKMAEFFGLDLSNINH